MTRNAAIRIGVTGGIACGKSEVGRVLSSAGWAVRDADEIAHRVMERGRPVYRKVVAHFGRTVLDADGAIDRRKLGSLVFADPEARHTLNAIVHPAVRRIWRRWARDRQRRGDTVAVIVPLLFEVGETAFWDAVICVTAPEQEALGRLRKRGLSAREARQRMAAQWPVEEKARHATYVLHNDGDLEKLRQRTLRLVRRIVRTGA